jgi:hypothetical protein
MSDKTHEQETMASPENQQTSKRRLLLRLTAVVLWLLLVFFHLPTAFARTLFGGLLLLAVAGLPGWLLIRGGNLKPTPRERHLARDHPLHPASETTDFEEKRNRATTLQMK